MRKEVIFAIVAGISVGILVAFGVWRVNNSLKTKTNEASQLRPEVEISPPTPQVSEFKVSLVEPEENDVIVENPATFSGITRKDSLIVVSAEDEDYIATADSQGSFSQDVKLVGGVNQIIVAAFNEEGARSQLTRTIVYSSEFAKQIAPSDSKSENSTDEADTIREKVQQKLEEAKNKPKFYIGTVTDKTKETLQIKNLKGEIKLASVGKDTSFIKIVKTTSEISVDDLAIGDFLVAMGFLSRDATVGEHGANEVLSAKRVLIIEALEPPKRTVILGEIASIEGKTITLKENDNDKNKIWTLNFPKRWKGPEIKELEEGEKLIVVGEPRENTITIRTIQSVSEAPTPTPEER